MADHATPVTSNAFADDGLVLPGRSRPAGRPGPRPGPSGRSLVSGLSRRSRGSPTEGLMGLDILSSPGGGSPAAVGPSGPSPRTDSAGSGELLLGEMLGLPSVDLR